MLVLFAEGRGDLWLVAATAAALSIPYHLLLMSPPNPYLPPGGFGGADTATALGSPATNASPVDPALSSHKPPGDTGGDSIFDYNQRNNTNIPPRRPVHGHQLMYSPSGVLTLPEAAAGSWAKRYWFGAALSCASFGAMMAILASKKDVAAFVAPF